MTKPVLLAALLACVLPGAVHAQLPGGIPLSVEVRAGAGIPVGSFADREEGIEAEPGFGFGVGALLEVTPTLSAYGGYQWTRFGCGECEEVGIDNEAIDSGFEVGVQADLPFRPAGLAPWARAGVLFHELEISDVSSDNAVGFAVGGGIVYPLGPALALTPGVHFRSYSANFELETFGLERETDVSHLTLDVGVAYRF